MRTFWSCSRIPVSALGALAIAATTAGCAIRTSGARVLPLEFRKELRLPAPPDAVFEAFTGDVSPWWDHTFVKKPRRLVLEAKVGGRFWEAFDDRGNGAVHARVIYVQRPKLLRFVGPLGLSGHAVSMVHELRFDPLPRGHTRLRLQVRGIGVLRPAWVKAVSRVWDHFLDVRFSPYVTSGRYRTRTPLPRPTGRK